jgi:hypothetical protein
MTLPAAIANTKSSKLNNPIELPSVEQIAEWDKLREEAIAALEISADNTFVKCQNCSRAIPIGDYKGPKVAE